MSKILIVVDMQNDFCLESGSLYVKGATPALWNIEELMYKEHFDRVWFTVDWHAFFHPSFKENGGEWPVHCVQYSQGAAINDLLLTACRNNNLRYDEVDDILSRYIPFKEYRQKHGEPLHSHDEMAESDCWSQLCARHGEDVVNKVWSRHLASEFKRKKAPIYIPRKEYEND